MSQFTHFCGNILAKKSCCAEIYRLLGLWPHHYTIRKATNFTIYTLYSYTIQYLQPSVLRIHNTVIIYVTENSSGLTLGWSGTPQFNRFLSCTVEELFPQLQEDKQWGTNRGRRCTSHHSTPTLLDRRPTLQYKLGSPSLTTI